MFTIGEFSLLTRLSVKALRLYHERGLLVPSRVDAATGYRWYDGRDLERALLIQRLRELGLSLDEIQRILADLADDGDLVEFLERKRAELEAELRRLRAAAGAVRGLIARERAAAAARGRVGRIEVCAIPPMLVASLRWRGRYADCGPAIGTVARAAAWRIGGPPFNLYHECECRDDGADIETCVPIRRPFTSRAVVVQELPAARCLRLVHEGPYDQLGRSYASLFLALRDRGLQGGVPIRETYLKGPGMIFRGDPARYLTGIEIPIIGAVDEGA